MAKQEKKRNPRRAKIEQRLEAKDFPAGGQLGETFHRYFIEYAGYVVCERAVPDIRDGLKPVQRRILYSMFDMHDGRLHKAANIIGQTMKLHPHGDKSIEDALVNLSHRGDLIDTQGNWGNPLTGDSAAAPRYIEARLTDFARTVLFNKKLTEWGLSYDERAEEPQALPARFPLLLYIGVEGIAVGLTTKIFPHNPGEICDAAIKFLNGESFKLFPDFASGGLIDTSDYLDGMQGGVIRHRAKLEFLKGGVLEVTELPYGVSPESFINSVVAIQEAGLINLKKIEDNSTKEPKILIYLKDIDDELSKDGIKELFYLKTRAEEKLHGTACVIDQKRPQFLSITEILKRSVLLTKDLLKRELEDTKDELNEKIHGLSLEEAFIRGRFYKELEKYDTEEKAVADLKSLLNKYLKGLTLVRAITDDDIKRLLGLPMRRITKFDEAKAKEAKIALEKRLAEVEKSLKNMVAYAIKHFEQLKGQFFKFGRKSKQVKFPQSAAVLSLQNKVKERVREVRDRGPLMYDASSGVVGSDLKFGIKVGEIATAEEVVVVTETGKVRVFRFKGRHMIGEPIIHCAPYRRGDTETIYSAVYEDLSTGEIYAKRFNLPQIILDRDYPVNPVDKAAKPGELNTKLWVMHVGTEAEAPEKVTIKFTKTKGKKLLSKVISLAKLIVKGRDSRGNLLTRNKVDKITSNG